MCRTLRALLFAVVLASALSVAAAASAKPAGWGSVDVTLHSESEGGVMVIAGDLPDATALPAEAELSVPKGSSLVWIGEILGGPLSEDPSLKYTKTTKGDADVYLVTLTKSRTAQVEVVADPYTTMGSSGYTASLVWPSVSAVPEVVAAIRVPAGSRATTGTAGAEMFTGDATYDYFSTTVKNVKAGGAVRLALTFTSPAVAAPAGSVPASSASGSDTVLWVVLLLALVAGVVLIVVAVTVRGTRRRALAPEGRTRDEAGPPLATAPLPDADEAEEADEGPAPRNPASTRRAIVTGAVVVVFVLVAVVVGIETNKARVTDDTISRTFAGGEACATASIALSVPAGADPATTAQSLFDALKAVPSVTTVTYNLAASTLEVGYCESSSSEAALREALAPTGLVSATP
jgi:hypothetical protein